MSKADWAGASVPTMWTSAQAADTEMAWQQVSAWQRTYDLLLHHEMRLEACRDELTFAWPPERSPAATAFVEYIDGLLVSIRRAKDDAVENHKALAGVLTSLASTRADMDKLKAEWDRHAADDAAMGANLPNDLFASGEDWQENLNEKARTRMAKNDQEVFEASAKMAELAGPWESIRTEPREPFSGGTSQSSAQSVAVGVGESGSRSSIGVSPMPVSSVSDVDRGMGLSGLQAPQPPASPPLGTQTPSSSNLPGGNPSAIPALPPTRGNSNRLVSQTRSSTTGLGGRIGGPSAGAFGRAAVGGPLPATARPVHWSNNASAAKVNPVGGVIGGSNHGTHGIGGMPFGAAGRVASGANAEHVPATTLQWEVPEGVPPVIEPEHERPFELGPGVIGLADDSRS